ncbi:hypothetical protein BHM03_00056365 [Ensete ventricosum]|nr:hypothetical protein BHM03_00056365 [Ensete ventricosum]
MVAQALGDLETLALCQMRESRWAPELVDVEVLMATKTVALLVGSTEFFTLSLHFSILEAHMKVPFSHVFELCL